MTTDALTYRIVYNRLDHDYTCYVTIDDVEQTIGSRPDHAAAEAHCRAYLYDYYTDNYTPEVAARIAAVEMSESLTTALYLDGADAIVTHATAAKRDEYMRYNPSARIIDPPFEETGAPSQDELHEWTKEDEAPELCEQCCACPATWKVREKSMVSYVCDTCYRNEFEENPDRHWSAWEADRLS